MYLVAKRFNGSIHYSVEPEIYPPSTNHSLSIRISRFIIPDHFKASSINGLIILAANGTLEEWKAKPIEKKDGIPDKFKI